MGFQTSIATTQRPVEFSAVLGRQYALTNEALHKKESGQYFTPPSVADFMGSLVHSKKKLIRILDPGAGAGILSCSVCESLESRVANIKEIELVAYETDPLLIQILRNVFDYLKEWLTSRKIEFSYEIIAKDFILENSHWLPELPSLFSVDKVQPKFDIVISNPPYFKISKDDPRAVACSTVIHGQPNIYALFLVVSAGMLNENGELIFITPRSFSSGPYFQRFREVFFSIISPERLHLFTARNKAFQDDEILQENLIFKATCNGNKSIEAEGRSVLISASIGSEALINVVPRNVPFERVIDLSSKSKILFVPISDEEDGIHDLVSSWEGSLDRYGIKISTGPVVPFRATQFISKTPESKEHAPLIWMQHVKKMEVNWPLPKTHKQQYIEVNEETRSLLVPNSNYVLLRRFSAKEEASRLTAAPLLRKALSATYIGLENHLNYIHRPKSTLTEYEAQGLAAILNSEVLDKYFRIFNGNTQVSATEIRSIPLPSLEAIEEIGWYHLKEKQASLNLVEFLFKKAG